MDDWRVDSLIEARKCLRMALSQKIDQPQFWANLLGSIANATMASVSDSVVIGVESAQARQKAARRKILENLDGD